MDPKRKIYYRSLTSDDDPTMTKISEFDYDHAHILHLIDIGKWVLKEEIRNVL
jgi:hypothetical protein